MSDPQFFGYGSLVNLATHSYAAPERATLHGWRRVWRHTSRRTVAYLSAEPAPGAAIDGVIAAVPGGDWAALDAREAAYVRRDVTVETKGTPTHGPVAVYEVTEGLLSDPSTAHPILLSYLDVVVQGYLQLFGEDGAEAFFASTQGWHAPILNDRAAPRYPRAQTLSPSETAFVDAALKRWSTR